MKRTLRGLTMLVSVPSIRSPPIIERPPPSFGGGRLLVRDNCVPNVSPEAAKVGGNVE